MRRIDRRHRPLPIHATVLRAPFWQSSVGYLAQHVKQCQVFRPIEAVILPNQASSVARVAPNVECVSLVSWHQRLVAPATCGVRIARHHHRRACWDTERVRREGMAKCHAATCKTLQRRHRNANLRVQLHRGPLHLVNHDEHDIRPCAPFAATTHSHFSSCAFPNRPSAPLISSRRRCPMSARSCISCR